MSIPVLTGLAGVSWEALVVETLAGPGGELRVVRRCMDLPDLLAAAAAGIARAAVLSADLRRLDRDALARLAASGVVPVGLTAPGDVEARDRLHGLGVRHVLPADASADDLAGSVTEALRDGGGVHPDAVYADPGAALGTPVVEPADETEPDSAPPGRLIAVWGPTGAPGRSSVAAGMAAEFALAGVSTLLADADVYGGTLAQSLGLLDEPAGLPAAARLASSAALDLAALERLAPVLAPSLRLLPGISRAERWPEIRPAALDPVWRLCRAAAEITVVDCGFSLEQDEELSFDVAAPRRNAATLLTLEAADLVLAVGAADPLGMQRLVRGLAGLRETAPTAAVRVVVNKVRRGPVGPQPEKQLAAALHHYAGVTDVSFVPYDLPSFDAALLAGGTLAEVAPRSPARTALSELAALLLGREPQTSRRRRGRAA